MTKRQSRLFFIILTGLSTLAFLILTLDSHRKFDELTHSENITPAVLAGKDVWHRKNCINCHTLLGEGAYYAPDLTKITNQRGAPYLKAFFKDPSQFYDEQRHRRLMPRQDLSDKEIDELIAFLDWVSRIENQGWPPRPILVTGASIPGTDIGKSAHPKSASNDPVALGEALFRSSPPACFTCHSIAPGVNLVGPSLAGIAGRAEKVISSPDYKGKAKDAAGYIRESIVDPNAYVITGQTYSSNGQSLMPANYGKDLTPEQIDQLVAYLATFK